MSAPSKGSWDAFFGIGFLDRASCGDWRRDFHGGEITRKALYFANSERRKEWKSLEWSSRKWKALHSWLEGHWNQSRTYLPDLGTLGKVGYYGKNDQLQEETMQWKELGFAAPVTMIHAQRKY